MNINDIIEGMAKSIVKEFGDVAVMSETIENDTPANGFNIRCISPMHRPVNNKRRTASDQFSVTYYRDGYKYDQDTNSVYERLEECLELISVPGGYIRGHDINATTSDGVFVLTVTYDYYLESDVDDSDKMRSYTLKEILYERAEIQ